MGNAKSFFEKDVGGFFIHTIPGAFKEAGNQVYAKVLRPAYSSVIKPLGEKAGDVVSHVVNAGEKVIDKSGDLAGKTLDTAGKVQDIAVNTAGGIGKGIAGLGELLGNPIFVIGGIVAAVVIAKTVFGGKR